MARPQMTKDRANCGVPIRNVGTKTKVQLLDGTEVEKTWKEEKVIRDPDGFILGVVTIWQ